MQLYIIRHAQATFQSIDGTDRGRTLADEGLLQAVKLGKFMKDNGIKPDLILCSPYRRTLETAHLIAEYGKIEPVQSENWLEAGMTPESALAELQAFKSFESIIIVGHQPDLGYLLEMLSDDHATVSQVPVASVHVYTGNLNAQGGKVVKMATE